MSWWSMIPVVAGIAALTFLPGWVVLRLLDVRGLSAVGAAPAVSAAVVGAVGLVSDALGAPWSLLTLVVGVVVVWALVLLLGLRARPWAQESPDRPLATPVRVALAGTALLAVAWTAFVLKSGMIAPDAVPQQWDGVFHVNGVATVLAERSGNPLHALDTMFGDGSSPFYYPAAWHVLVAAGVGPGGAVAAANASTFVIAGGVWIAGVVALTRAVFPRSATAAVSAPVAALLFTAFPTWLLSTSAQWPNGAATAMLPGVVALLVARARDGRPGTRLVSVVAVGAAVLGVLLMHPSSAFSLVVVAGPWAALVLVRASRRGVADGRAGFVAVCWAVGAAALALGIVVVSRSDLLAVVTSYPRPGWLSYSGAAELTLLDYPGVGRWLGVPAVLVVVVGAVATFLRRQGRWLVVSWLLALGLAMLIPGPENPFRWLTGFWYKDVVRVGALVVVTAAPLAAFGVASAADAAGRLARRLSGSGGAGARSRAVVVPVAWAVLVVLLAVSTQGFRFVDRRTAYRATYDVTAILGGPMVTAGERELLGRLDQLPAGSTVLGDRFSGAPFAFAVAGVPVVLPQLGGQNVTLDQRFLEQSFASIHDDPAVCDVVRRLGITHFYAEEPAVVQGTDVAARAPGLFGVDTSTGFEPVDAGGSVTVYRITGCDA